VGYVGRSWGTGLLGLDALHPGVDGVSVAAVSAVRCAARGTIARARSAEKSHCVGVVRGSQWPAPMTREGRKMPNERYAAGRYSCAICTVAAADGITIEEQRRRVEDFAGHPPARRLYALSAGPRSALT
jgi:hypothetical protein